MKREMRAEPVIVGGISRQDPAKMRLTEHDDMIEALTSLDRYPDIKLELSVTDRRVDLIRESFDIAVRIGEMQGQPSRSWGPREHDTD